VNLAFLGTPQVAVPFLHAVHGAGHSVAMVVCNPDRPSGRSGRPQPPPVKQAAEKLGLSVWQPKGARGPVFLRRITECHPDLLVVVAYGRILPLPVLETAVHGAVNVHFSLLPKFRGAAPVQWSLARGEQVTGVSTMLLNEGMDEGDVLLQKEVRILPGEHTPALHHRLVEAGLPLLLETIDGLEAGNLLPIPQYSDAATYAPMIGKEDGEPQPASAAAEIEGRVRGFDPWPGVWFLKAGRRIRIREAHAVASADHDTSPGTVLELREGALHIACGDRTVLAVTVLQPEGKRAISAVDSVNGRHLVPGDVLVACGDD